jgi:hypothetical protein
VQRTSSDLRLNPHYHSAFLDGVFAPGEDAKLEFHRSARSRTASLPT